MKLRILLLMAVMGLMLSSCTTYQYVTSYVNEDSFVGKSHAEIIDMYGAPNSEHSDGKGGLILSYEGNRKMFGYSRKYSRNSSTVPTLQVYLNEEGICTATRKVNTEAVRAVNAWWTVLLVLGILVIL